MDRTGEGVTFEALSGLLGVCLQNNMHEDAKVLADKLIEIMDGWDGASRPSKSVHAQRPTGAHRDGSIAVVGARAGSLGAAVSEALGASTFGISGDEDYTLDIEDRLSKIILGLKQPRVIVCTVGINQPSLPFRTNFDKTLTRSMEINFHGPMNLLRDWAIGHRFHVDRDKGPSVFIAISSNSAHVARSQSTAYCSSKAALSMGIRSMARYFASEGIPVCAMAIEPGWIEGTPMSEEVEDRLDSQVSPHRIPGGRAITKKAVVDLVKTMIDNPYAYNGTTVRIDGGEQ